MIYLLFGKFVSFCMMQLLGWDWGHIGFTLTVCLSVRLSVCGQNRVRSVSSAISSGSISYLHMLLTYFRRCRVLSCIKNYKVWFFGNFFKFARLTLSCVHVMWMLQVDSSSEILLKQLLILHDDASRWFTQQSSGFGQNFNFVFLHFF